MPKLLTRAALISMLSLSAVASYDAQTPGANPPPGFPAPGQPPIVTLMSAGAAPRSALRYAIAANYKTHMDMSMTMGMSMTMAGMPAQQMQLPAMKMGADVSVTNVTSAGDVSYEFAYTSVRLDDSGGVDPTLASLVQSMDADLKTVHGSATMTSRGATRDARMDTSKVTSPQMSQMLSSFSSSLDSLTVPLPEEAVGAGARWESRQTIQSGGFRVFQKTLWELVAVDGQTVKLKATVEQTAPPQPINNPSMPPGADVALEQFTGGGTGTVAINLDSMVPTSELNSSTNMTMSVNAGGSAQRISVGSTLKMTIAPGKS